MLSERYNSELVLASNLKRINDMNFAVTTHESLLDGIICFKSDMLNQSNYTKEFCNSIKLEMLDPLQKTANSVFERVKKISTNLQNEEKLYNLIIAKLDNSRIKFHSAAKAVENAKLQSEASKNNNTITQEDKMKNEKKVQELLKIAKETEIVYVSMINQANTTQYNYIENKKKALNDIQSLEEEIGECIKDSLRKYVIFQASLIRNMQYDLNKKAQLMESINIKKDIRNFIYNNSTNELPPYKFEFIPYISNYSFNMNKQKNNNNNNKNQSTSTSNENVIPKEVVKDVKSFISNIFFKDESTIELSDIYENKIQREIDAIVTAIFSSKQIPSEYHKTITEYINYKKTMRMLLNSMNQIRVKSVFTLSDIAYNSICDILNECLDVIKSKDFDYESLRMVVNLSTSLYKNANAPNKPRVFLQAKMSENKIWKDKELWKKLIEYNIIEEMHSQKNYIIYNNETFEQKEERIKLNVKSQLNSSIYNMLSLNVDESIMKNVIEDFIEQYELDDKCKEEFSKMIKGDKDK